MLNCRAVGTKSKGAGHPLSQILDTIQAKPSISKVMDHCSALHIFRLSYDPALQRCVWEDSKLQVQVNEYETDPYIL